MKIYKKIGKKPIKAAGDVSSSVKKADGDISSSINDNIKKLEALFQDFPDMVKRKIILDSDIEGYFFYIDGLIDIDIIQRNFFSIINSLDYKKLSDKDFIANLPFSTAEVIGTFSSAVSAILSGETLFFCDGMNFAIAYKAKIVEKRYRRARR